MSKAEDILRNTLSGNFWVFTREDGRWILIIYKNPRIDPTILAIVPLSEEQAEAIQKRMKGQDDGETPTR